MLDAVVVGGGPAGSASARLLASEGYSIRVLEEHPCSGRPVQCAGLVSAEVIRMSGVKPDVLSTLYGAEVVFPDGGRTVVRSSAPKLFSIDRADLDEKMAGAAMDAGAEFSYGDRYSSHSVLADRVDIDSASGGLSSRAIIGADGHTSAVASSLGDNGPREYIRGVQADVRADSGLDGLFRAHLGSRYAPGFFTWEFQCGDFVRVGLCTSWSAGPPYPYLKKMLDDMYPGRERIALYSGKIPMGGRRAICGDRCMLIGDAAGQVKPVSAGGLHPMLSSVTILSDVLSSALDADDLSVRALRPYERRFRSGPGRELDRSYSLRKLFVRMSDEKISEAGRFSAREDVRRILDGIDIDHPGLVAKKVLTKPSLIPSAAALLLRCLL